MDSNQVCSTQDAQNTETPGRRSDPYKPKRLWWERLRLYARAQLQRFPLIEAPVIHTWRTSRFLTLKSKWKLEALAGSLQGTRTRDVDVDKIYWVSPQSIAYSSLQEFNVHDFKGRVIGGNWDLLEKRFDDLDIYVALRQVCLEGKSWPETIFYRRMLAEPE